MQSCAKQLQIELKQLQQQVGITFIYVTHDQEEALTMSDRIAVMSHGKVEQVAPPVQVYEEPSTVFVADFLGVSNLMTAIAQGADIQGRCRVRLGSFELSAGRGDQSVSGNTKITIRPERVRLEMHGTSGENRVPGMVERWVYLGNAVQLIVRLATGEKLQVLMQNTGDNIPFAQGTPVHAHLPAEALRVLVDTGVTHRPNKRTELRLRSDRSGDLAPPKQMAARNRASARKATWRCCRSCRSL